MTEPVPAWLANWRENTLAAAAQRDKHKKRGNTPKPKAPAVASAQHRGGNTYGFIVPERWPNDGGVRRESVLDTDHNPPRVVRKVGWQRCIACGSPFFSEDVIALRLCDGASSCRDPKDHNTNWGKPHIPNP